MAKASAREIGRGVKLAGLKAQIEKLRRLDLHNAYLALGHRAYEVNVMGDRFEDQYAQVRDFEKQTKELRQGSVAEADAGVMAKAKAKAITAKMRAQAELLARKLNGVLAEVGQAISDAGTDQAEIAQEIQAASAVAQRIQTLQVQYDSAVADHSARNELKTSARSVGAGAVAEAAAINKADKGRSLLKRRSIWVIVTVIVCVLLGVGILLSRKERDVTQRKELYDTPLPKRHSASAQPDNRRVAAESRVTLGTPDDYAQFYKSILNRTLAEASLSAKKKLKSLESHPGYRSGSEPTRDSKAEAAAISSRDERKRGARQAYEAAVSEIPALAAKKESSIGASDEVKTRKLNEYRQQLKEGAENRLRYALADADTRYKEDLERVNAIKDTRLSQERSYAEQVDKIENDLAAASKQAKQHYSTALDLAELQRKSRSKLVRQYGVSPYILEFVRAPELTSLQRSQIKDTLWSSARQLAHMSRVRHVFVQLPDLQYRIDDVKRRQTRQTVRLKCGKEDEAEYSEISKLLGNTCGIRWPTLILPLDCPATASWNKGGKIRARDWILPVNVSFNPSTGEVEHLGSEGVFRNDAEYLEVMQDQTR